jgi:hypothetical protein
MVATARAYRRTNLPTAKITPRPQLHHPPPPRDGHAEIGYFQALEEKKIVKKMF